MKLAPASLASALAINVLPHPGGPYSINPVFDVENSRTDDSNQATVELRKNPYKWGVCYFTSDELCKR